MSRVARPRLVAVNILILLALCLASSLAARWRTKHIPDHLEAVRLYEARFSDADLRRIPPLLKAEGIWSAIRDASLWVEVDDLAAARARMAQQNLPRDMTFGLSPTNFVSGTTATAIIPSGNSGMGKTAMEYEAARKQLAEGAIVEALRHFRGVRDAQVKLATPQKVCWPPPGGPRSSARFLLNLEPGFTPTAIQVNGMVRLVAEIDRKIRYENVSVVDLDGRDLTFLAWTGQLE